MAKKKKAARKKARKKTTASAKPRLSLRVSPGTLEAGSQVFERVEGALVTRKADVFRLALVFGLDAFLKDPRKVLKANQLNLSV